MNDKELLQMIGGALRDLGEMILKRADGGAAPGTAKTSATPEPRLMTVKSYAKRAGYATSTVQRWVKMGIPHVPSGRGVRIKVAAADAWIESGGARETARVFSRGKDRAVA